MNNTSFNQLDKIIYVDDIKVQLYLLYKYYAYYSFAFDKINIYEYLIFISIIKYFYSKT